MMSYRLIARTNFLPWIPVRGQQRGGKLSINGRNCPGFGLDVVDYFGDGSVFIVDAPGHLFGHVNLLARVGRGGGFISVGIAVMM
jgi:hypothetical protein